MTCGWGKPKHRLNLLYEDDSGPPSVDYWGVDTPVVDVRRLADSLVGYTCTPRDLNLFGGVNLYTSVG